MNKKKTVAFREGNTAQSCEPRGWDSEVLQLAVLSLLKSANADSSLLQKPNVFINFSGTGNAAANVHYAGLMLSL